MCKHVNHIHFFFFFPENILLMSLWRFDELTLKAEADIYRAVCMRCVSECVLLARRSSFDFLRKNRMMAAAERRLFLRQSITDHLLLWKDDGWNISWIILGVSKNAQITINGIEPNIPVHIHGHSLQNSDGKFCFSCTSG